MQIVETYSHLNGLEYLLVHHPKLWKELQAVVKLVDSEAAKTKVSKEKTKMGKMLYSPMEMNSQFKTLLTEKDWSESRYDYWVTKDEQLIRKTMGLPAKEQRKMIEQAGAVPIKSYNQTDFVKQRVAVEVQFGKYSFIAYDLFVKHMAFYVGNEIDVGVEILPMKNLQAQMSSGPGYYEGALYDLIRQGRGVPAVPLVLIGVAA